MVGGAHNEALILAVTAAALLVYVGDREASGAALATAATAVKASAGAPRAVPDRGRAVAPTGGGRDAPRPRSRSLLLIGLAGFGSEAVGWLDAVRENQARTSSFSLPFKTSELLGAVLPADRLDFRAPMRFAYAGALATVASWLLWRTWRGASAWLVPWYLAWLLAGGGWEEPTPRGRHRRSPRGRS